ncbi:protein MEMO1-like [Ptychodera flava]|uniref:protein MEMO1-like n=1 Tax=Ptychodera flava TaxID=63121 RepID=UPI00396A8278
MSSQTRKATHAGSWYSRSGKDLSAELGQWLAAAAADHDHRPARAIIAPHAGYFYCGKCGAHAYRQVDAAHVRRVFILGPSHHVRLGGCALSMTTTYNTPLYNLPIDTEIYRELWATGEFEKMSLQTDEDEHSIEMQLPYIAKVMESRKNDFTIVPVLVGALSTEKEQKYGRLFSKYLAQPENLFVISSDFCHWGERFRFTHYDKSHGEIYKSIEALDHKGMKLIEDLDPAGFAHYLKKYGNTICGRHPIGVLLNAIATLREKENGHKMSLKFLNYDQSQQCRSMDESSVSYAAASLAIR